MNCIFCTNEVILKGENFCCDRFKQIAEFRNEQKNEIEITLITLMNAILTINVGYYTLT